uniref:DUF4283 domain-containing protein n=1 Tax=Cannabis sativa TaxID=3483 RepID=A0A803QIQ3_CANSA
MERQVTAFAIDDDEEGLLFEKADDGLSEIDDDRWLLVGRFLTNRSIDFQAMQNKMATLWQPGWGLYVKELDSNLFYSNSIMRWILKGLLRAAHEH